MGLSVPSLSIDQSVPEIAEFISKSSHGVMLLTHLPHAPFEAIRQLIDECPLVADRLSKRTHPKNLVYKDSHSSSENRGRSSVDHKRVLDLSPERLAVMKCVPQKDYWNTTLDFWKEVEPVAQKVLKAVALAIGSDDIFQDVAYSFRMVEYYSNKDDVCREHRDFGMFTLVFAAQPGLQVYTKGEWKNVPEMPPGSAMLLFGWCTHIRSNGRIPAALHKVGGCSDKSRTAAILFGAPQFAETPLEPVLLTPSEKLQYVRRILAGQLPGSVAGQWGCEGTLGADGEEIIRGKPLKKRDDRVKYAESFWEDRLLPSFAARKL